MKWVGLRTEREQVERQMILAIFNINRNIDNVNKMTYIHRQLNLKWVNSQIKWVDSQAKWIGS